MKSIILIATLALANGKPEYSYDRPAGGLESFALQGNGGGFGAAGLGAGSGGFSSTGPASGGFGNGAFGGGGVQVHKHVYVHAEPDDDIIAGPGGFNGGPTGSAQKHYKIIFIKTPSYAQELAQQAAFAAAAAQAKTLVYVLSRKPDALAEGGAPGALGSPFAPSKPEVYFIKYKAQTGAGSGAGAGQGASSGGFVTDSVFDGLAALPSASYGPAL